MGDDGWMDEWMDVYFPPSSLNIIKIKNYVHNLFCLTNAQSSKKIIFHVIINHVQPSIKPNAHMRKCIPRFGTRGGLL